MHAQGIRQGVGDHLQPEARHGQRTGRIAPPPEHVLHLDAGLIAE